MEPSITTSPFVSSLTYEHSRIRAAALYCSDGRFGEHFDDFLHNGLGLPRYDRLALPGGPACLISESNIDETQRNNLTQLCFLIDAHELTRIVLIQHDQCAYYHQHLAIPSAQAEARQISDLARVVGHIRRASDLKRIDAFFARICPQGLAFEEVDAG